MQTGKEVMSILQELNNSGKTIIMVTHDVNIASYAHRILRIEDGRIQDERKNQIHIGA